MKFCKSLNTPMKKKHKANAIFSEINLDNPVNVRKAGLGLVHLSARLSRPFRAHPS